MVRWGVVLCVMSAAAALASPVTYSVAPYIWVSPAPYVTVFGPNDSGQITAESFPEGYAAGHSVGTPSVWGGLPLITVMQGLNNLGQVTGINHQGQAFVASTSEYTLVPLPPGAQGSIGYAVSDSGQVTGAAYYGTTEFAFIGTTSSSTQIPPPSGWVLTMALGINNASQVVGVGITSNGFQYQAFIGTVSGSDPIPLLPGWTDSDARTINNSGEVAGDGNNGSADQAFVWTAAGTTMIPMLSGASDCYASFQGKAINNSGVVVGDCDTGPWIWDSVNGTQSLNSFLPSGWTIDTVYGINDPGQIFAEASFSGGPDQYVLLTPQSTPAPEPGTFGMLAAGLAFAVKLRRSTL